MCIKKIYYAYKSLIFFANIFIFITFDFKFLSIRIFTPLIQLFVYYILLISLICYDLIALIFFSK
jgi:hypothetical protein